jgi:formamidopyrimidine-DNA glycosylase
VPELPEVETVRSDIAPLIVGWRVRAAELLRRDVLVAPGDPFGGFSRQRGKRAKPAPLFPGDLLEDLTIAGVERRGKHIAILAESRSTWRALGVQLGMSGEVRFTSGDEPAKPHTHARWSFDHGKLEFIDPRRFGGLRVFRAQADLAAHWLALGPDALAITAEQLAENLVHSQRAIKAALLDQGVLAGVGNIYADESLFQAGISPKFRADRLSLAQIDRLAAAIRDVLGHAVRARGSTVRDFKSPAGEAGRYQGEHKVYGRKGQPCPRCTTTLRSTTLAQRSTVWCPTCQPAKPA